MITLKSKQEIELMRRAGKITAAARALAGEMVTPGVTTQEIDKAVYHFIKSQGAIPSFLNYHGFTGSICASVMGVFCDLTISVPIPCFYTLVFPVIGMLAGLIAKNWLPMSFWCAAILSLLAFTLTDSFHFLLLVLKGGGHAAQAAIDLACRETGASMPFLIPVYFVFRRIYEICHVYD